MASNRFESLYECVACEQQLNRLSKCLPCLHGVCQSYFGNTLDKANTNCTCPKCHAQFGDLKDFGISPIIVKELMRQELSSPSEFQCDWCSEDGISSVAKFWCGECEKLFCNHCIRYHKRVTQKEHVFKDLDAMRKSDAIALVMKMQNNCVLHEKELEMYCENCSNCYCDKCYATHANDLMTLCTNVTPLRVRDKIVKCKEQFHTLGQKMTSFEEEVKTLTENVSRFVNEFKSDCEIKRAEIWSEYKSICEKAKHDALWLTDQIDDGMQEILAKYHQVTQQNDEILQEISTWRLNFDHLMSEDLQDVHLLCGMQMLEKQCPVLRHELPSMETKYEILVEYPEYWCKKINSLQNKNDGFVTFEKVGKIRKVSKENRFDLPAVKEGRHITSIFVNQKDEHIFVCDGYNNSLIELKENGEFQSEFKFFSFTKDKFFKPLDICLISTENIFVVCGSLFGKKKLLFLKKKTHFPFFELKHFFATKINFVSCFENKQKIFVLDENFQIHSFSEECKKLKIFQIEAFQHISDPFLSRIRFDCLNEKIWFSNSLYPKLICLDSNFKQIDSMEKEKKFLDFHFNGFEKIFFCDTNEIFSLPNQKLFQFDEEQNSCFYSPRIFVFKKKIFVSVEKNGKFGIEIFY